MTDLPLPPRDPPPSSGADANSGGKSGDKDDAHEWDKAVKDVRPLTPSNRIYDTQRNGTAKSSATLDQAAARRANTARRFPNPPNPGIDRRTALRLREGRMEIDGRIDLHGMTLAQAHQAVVRFILQMVAAEKRCLLVITGKGQRDERVGAETGHGTDNPAARSARHYLCGWASRILHPIFFQPRPRVPNMGAARCYLCFAAPEPRLTLYPYSI